MKKLISVALMVLVAGAASWFFFTPKPAAPLVSFETLEDKSLTMASLRGKVVLVKFWATSCVTCVQQMPDTIELYNDLKADGLEVIAVAMDYDPIEFVRNFVVTRQLPFVISHDQSGALAKAFGDVKLTPIAFLVDRDGRILRRYLGTYEKQEMRKTVEKALAS